ncbi:hypothetical protein Tco_0733446 [Tanacetum coccineum]
MEECHLLLTDQTDLVNPEGNRTLPGVSKPLPLGGPPGQAIRTKNQSWDATNFLFKEDYTILSKPKAVIYRDRNNQKKIMREDKVRKFSDDTLTRILEKLVTWLKISGYSSTIRTWKIESGLRMIKGGVKSLWR